MKKMFILYIVLMLCLAGCGKDTGDSGGAARRDTVIRDENEATDASAKDTIIEDEIMDFAFKNRYAIRVDGYEFHLPFSTYTFESLTDIVTDNQNGLNFRTIEENYDGWYVYKLDCKDENVLLPGNIHVGKEVTKDYLEEVYGEPFSTWNGNDSCAYMWKFTTPDNVSGSLSIRVEKTGVVKEFYIDTKTDTVFDRFGSGCHYGVSVEEIHQAIENNNYGTVVNSVNPQVDETLLHMSYADEFPLETVLKFRESGNEWSLPCSQKSFKEEACLYDAVTDTWETGVQVSYATINDEKCIIDIYDYTGYITIPGGYAVGQEINIEEFKKVYGEPVSESATETSYKGQFAIRNEENSVTYFVQLNVDPATNIIRSIAVQTAEVEEGITVDVCRKPVKVEAVN